MDIYLSKYTKHREVYIAAQTCFSQLSLRGSVSEPSDTLS